MIERTISSIGEFLETIQEDIGTYKGSVWYRGHSDANWSLLPGYIRSSPKLSESTLMNRFKQSAAMLTDRMPRDSFDWLFLMQHYGAPTRLLDWSESPLVGMFFALDRQVEFPDKDAALWCLLPTELNRYANIDSSEEFYVPSFEDLELKGYSTESVGQNTRVKLSPVATIATRNNLRIQAQMGTFTIHHNDDTAIEAVGNSKHIIKYTLPAYAKPQLMRELRLLSINRFSMFPELASVGRALMESMT